MHSVLFNKIIVYSPDEGTLYNINNPSNVIKLYYSANRCLQILIAHNSTPVMQRFFLEEVWENKGQSASANTFYQCISSIRKAFANLSLEEDIIKTIPRKGILLSPGVSVDFIKASDEDEDTKANYENYAPRRLNVYLLSVLTSAVFILIFTFFMLAFHEKVDFKNLYTLTGKFQNYTIYREAGDQTKMEAIEEAISDENISNNPPGDIYYASTENPSRESIIYCPLDKKIKCKSFYRIK